MLTLENIPWAYVRSPLPLHQTPLALRLLGYPRWRFISQAPHNYGRWVYLTPKQYDYLFGKL